MGYHYREYDAGVGRSRVLGNRFPKFCIYCGRKLVQKITPSDRFDRETGQRLTILAFDCPNWRYEESLGTHERYYIDDDNTIRQAQEALSWKEYLNKDA